jgi:hypothetical protein
MTPLAGLITVIVGLLALADWRKGLLAVIIIGVLQDVLRKLTPGVPTYFIVWSMAIYLVVVVLAWANRSLPPLSTIYLGEQRAQNAWLVFIFLVLFQLLNALVRWGSPAVPIFGALFYLGPPLAMLVGYAFADSPKRIGQFLTFYVVILTPTCLTVYLSPTFQDSWPVLRDVGTFIGRELIIYDVGTALKSYSGILRAGEISAWHAATVGIFLATLAMTSRRNSRRVVTVLVIALMIGVIVLTGRRKMLMTLSIFFLVQWALMARFKRGMGKQIVLVVLVGTLASFSFTLLEPASESSLYVQRSATVFGDAAGRFETAIMLMRSAFDRSSGIGLGAGSAAQGARYAGIDQSKLVGGSGESGLGMFMVELGLIGLLAAAWLLFVIGRSLSSNLRRLAALDENLFYFQVAFLSFLFANLMTFMVATQIYGDFFVLIILGTVGGFVVRINSVVRNQSMDSQKIQALQRR